MLVALGLATVGGVQRARGMHRDDALPPGQIAGFAARTTTINPCLDGDRPYTASTSKHWAGTPAGHASPEADLLAACARPKSASARLARVGPIQLTVVTTRCTASWSFIMRLGKWLPFRTAICAVRGAIWRGYAIPAAGPCGCRGSCTTPHSRRYLRGNQQRCHVER